MVESGAVKASPKQPRTRRFSTLGALLTVAIAGVIGYVAWHIIPRGRTASSEGAAAAGGSASSIVSCVFPASFWTDQNGQKQPIANLADIELQNILWISSKHEHGKKADFHAGGPRAADLSCVDLSDFKLREADLQGTEMSGAKLSGADLSGANLSQADLTGADLSSIIGRPSTE